MPPETTGSRAWWESNDGPGTHTDLRPVGPSSPKSAATAGFAFIQVGPKSRHLWSVKSREPVQRTAVFSVSGRIGLPGCRGVGACHGPGRWHRSDLIPAACAQPGNPPLECRCSRFGPTAQTIAVGDLASSDAPPEVTPCQLGPVMANVCALPPVAQWYRVRQSTLVQPSSRRRSREQRSHRIRERADQPLAAACRRRSTPSRAQRVGVGVRSPP